VDMKRATTHSRLLLTLATLFVSCSHIHNGKELSSREIQQIKEIGLLNPQEKIYQFYSNAPFNKTNAGNFYSTERIAHYWLDDNKRKTQVNFAYYRDIKRITTTYNPHGDFVIPFITVIKKDSTQFNVYVEGDKSDVKFFFDSCFLHWRAGK
jgi:hypothetical protein